MSGATVAELLADLIGPASVACVAPTPAKAAKAANRQHPCGLLADSVPCESLRTPANPHASGAIGEPDSQSFAAVRSGRNRPESKQWRGFSQDSHDSQGSTSAAAMLRVLDLAPVAWTDADVERFLDRRGRLLRWGWPEADAEKLAERLVRRHRESDTRVSCTECRHYRPDRCGNHKAAMLGTPDVGRDLATLLQHCPGYQLGVTP